MADEKQEVVIQVVSWFPQNIIDLIGHLAWPVVLLFLAWLAKDSLSGVLKKFLDNNNISELSAGASGISARFEAKDQGSDIDVSKISNMSTLPESANLDSIKEFHNKNETYLSADIYHGITSHINQLAIDDKESIELLAKDLSLAYASLNFNTYNRVLFRTQYDFFSGYMSENSNITEEELRDYFKSVVAEFPDKYKGWDHLKYIAYPISEGLIECTDGTYNLTKKGLSYIEFMKKNVNLISALSPI